MGDDSNVRVHLHRSSFDLLYILWMTTSLTDFPLVMCDFVWSNEYLEMFTILAFLYFSIEYLLYREHDDDIIFLKKTHTNVTGGRNN